MLSKIKKLFQKASPLKISTLDHLLNEINKLIMIEDSLSRKLAVEEILCSILHMIPSLSHISSYYFVGNHLELLASTDLDNKLEEEEIIKNEFFLGDRNKKSLLTGKAIIGLQQLLKKKVYVEEISSESNLYGILIYTLNDHAEMAEQEKEWFNLFLKAFVTVLHHEYILYTPDENSYDFELCLYTKSTLKEELKQRIKKEKETVVVAIKLYHLNSLRTTLAMNDYLVTGRKITRYLLEKTKGQAYRVDYETIVCLLEQEDEESISFCCKTMEDIEGKFLFQTSFCFARLREPENKCLDYLIDILEKIGPCCIRYIPYYINNFDIFKEIQFDWEEYQNDLILKQKIGEEYEKNPLIHPSELKELIKDKVEEKQKNNQEDNQEDTQENTIENYRTNLYSSNPDYSGDERDNTEIYKDTTSIYEDLSETDEKELKTNEMNTINDEISWSCEMVDRSKEYSSLENIEDIANIEDNIEMDCNDIQEASIKGTGANNKEQEKEETLEHSQKSNEYEQMSFDFFLNGF